MEDIFSKDSKPVQRSKEYLEALIALGGDIDAIEQERAIHEDTQHDSADHGSSAWGGPRHLHSNWGAGFNGHGRCRRTGSAA